jgi:hypothetical protein
MKIRLRCAPPGTQGLCATRIVAILKLEVNAMATDELLEELKGLVHDLRGRLAAQPLRGRHGRCRCCCSQEAEPEKKSQAEQAAPAA